MNRKHKYRFFFAPDMGGNLGGDSSFTVDDHSGAGTNQQQQQPQGPASPFADIDKDLLDDKTRASIEKAEQQFAMIAKEAEEKKQFQSRYDRTQAELDQFKQQAAQSSQQQQQRQIPRSMREEVEATMLESGVPANQVKALAEMQTKILEKHEARIRNEMHQEFAPMVGNQLMSNANSAFQSASANDPIGIFAVPEVAQQVWEQTQQMAQRGELVNPEMVKHLGRIHYMQHLENNPNRQSPIPNFPGQINQPNMNPNPQPAYQPQQQSTRFSYPGAGNFAQRPLQQLQNNRGSTLDPDTAAAISAITAGWPTKKGGKR
jgi:hypothetical protein